MKRRKTSWNLSTIMTLIIQSNTVSLILLPIVKKPLQGVNVKKPAFSNMNSMLIVNSETMDDLM